MLKKTKWMKIFYDLTPTLVEFLRIYNKKLYEL